MQHAQKAGTVEFHCRVHFIAFCLHSRLGVPHEYKNSYPFVAEFIMPWHVTDDVYHEVVNGNAKVFSVIV